jgi:hypothetical protein
VPLIKVSRHEQLARAEGPLAHGRWQGDASSAPAALRGWVYEVPNVFLQLEHNMKIPRPPDEFAAGCGPGTTTAV